MTFGENLISLRKKIKMTQEEVAEKLQITRQTVSNWELNQTKPDLEQLKELSRFFKISIDELVDNNVGKLTEEKPSKLEKSNFFYKIVNFTKENKKVILMIFSLMCIIAIGTCLIVDYSIYNTITWGYIPLVSIVFGYLLVISLFSNKNKIISFLSVLTITILPFLYLLEQAISIDEWFYPAAVSISLVSILGIWITYLVCYVLKINTWYKAAIIIFMWGGVLSPIINHIGEDLPYISLQNFSNIFSSLVISLVCIICGYIKNTKLKRSKAM